MSGGHPVKPPVNARGFQQRAENLPPGRRPLEKTTSRQRITAPCEQPAVLYKTSSNNNSSNNLVAQGQSVSTPPRQSGLPQTSSHNALSRMVSNGSANGSKKAVKFEDDPPPAKKLFKEKTSHGEGDGYNGLAKRFSFDGRAIRDRLPYVKRSSEQFRL